LVSFIELTEAMVTALRAIPEVVALLGGDPLAIDSYIDRTPDRNSVNAAIYQMRAGSVLVVWRETLLSEGEIEGWVHNIEICLRAARGGSVLELGIAIINGTPVPGDGQRWRYCPLMGGVLPTTVPAITRPMDEEGIDYFTIMTETKETGDA
jgi:hypothetical protein